MPSRHPHRLRRVCDRCDGSPGRCGAPSRRAMPSSPPRRQHRHATETVSLTVPTLSPEHVQRHTRRAGDRGARRGRAHRARGSRRARTNGLDAESHGDHARAATWSAVLELAHERGVDAIVCGTRGRGGSHGRCSAQRPRACSTTRTCRSSSCPTAPAGSTGRRCSPTTARNRPARDRGHRQPARRTSHRHRACLALAIPARSHRCRARTGPGGRGARDRQAPGPSLEQAANDTTSDGVERAQAAGLDATGETLESNAGGGGPSPRPRGRTTRPSSSAAPAASAAPDPHCSARLPRGSSTTPTFRSLSCRLRSRLDRAPYGSRSTPTQAAPGPTAPSRTAGACAGSTATTSSGTSGWSCSPTRRRLPGARVHARQAGRGLHGDLARARDADRYARAPADGRHPPGLPRCRRRAPPRARVSGGPAALPARAQFRRRRAARRARDDRDRRHQRRPGPRDACALAR